MVGHGGSSASSYLADHTSPIPSHCASIVTTSTLRVNPGLDAPSIQLHVFLFGDEILLSSVLLDNICSSNFIPCGFVCQTRCLLQSQYVTYCAAYCNNNKINRLLSCGIGVLVALTGTPCWNTILSVQPPAFPSVLFIIFCLTLITAVLFINS